MLFETSFIIKLYKEEKVLFLWFPYIYIGTRDLCPQGMVPCCFGISESSGLLISIIPESDSVEIG